jgi:hypothetical protein
MGAMQTNVLSQPAFFITLCESFVLPKSLPPLGMAGLKKN